MLYKKKYFDHYYLNKIYNLNVNKNNKKCPRFGEDSAGIRFILYTFLKVAIAL